MRSAVVAHEPTMESSHVVHDPPEWQEGARYWHMRGRLHDSLVVPMAAVAVSDLALWRRRWAVEFLLARHDLEQAEELMGSAERRAVRDTIATIDALARAARSGDLSLKERGRLVRSLMRYQVTHT